VIQCPRCKVDAELVSLGPVDVDHCVTCGNMWFDNLELERATSAADGALGADLRDAVRALKPSRSPSSGPAVIGCPFCSEQLIRRNHPTVPDVVAQVCFTHGAWLERLHLLRLLDDIETQGLEALKTRDKRREAQRKEHNRSVERQLEPVRNITRYHVWFWFP
jgi:Zn-finger nucleic acid-binding protein